jgi:serine/threonine protein kinase
VLPRDDSQVHSPIGALTCAAEERLRESAEGCVAVSKNATNAMTNIESGKELGRYELLVPIARGGMAQVWAARLQGSRGFSKLVAVKVILPGGMDNSRLEQMFLEEASLAGLIHHPNVVETIELGEHEGTLYLVMEWVEGESLRFVQNRAEERGGLPLTVAVNLVGQTCKGLHAAHELCGEDGRPLGLVHRDISPQNILVTYTGAAKIVDFGIAKATGRSSALTEAGEIKGKVSYMSPEQLKGGSLDCRSDLFALGILLFMLTTGTHPFKGTNPGETVRRIACNDIVARPSELIPNYPKKLEAVVLKALSHDVNARWPSARDLLLALEEALPRAFDSSAESEVRLYLNELLGERAQQRRNAVRVAREALASGKPPPALDSPASLISTATPSVSVLPPADLGVGPRRRLVVGIASATALFGVLGLGVHFALGSPAEQGSRTSPVPASGTASLTSTPSIALTATPPSPVSIEPAASVTQEPRRAPDPRSAARTASSHAPGSASVRQRAAPRKPRADAWDPKNFGSRH